MLLRSNLSPILLESQHSTQVADKQFFLQDLVRHIPFPLTFQFTNSHHRGYQRNRYAPSNLTSATQSPAILTTQYPANDAAVVPPPSPSHGSYHWTFERLIAVAIIPLTVAPFVGGTLNPVMDAILCGTILIHSHIGFESCIIDYFPNKRVPKTRTTMNWALKASTLLVGVGLYEFETNDVGVTEAIKRIWTA